MDSFYVLVAVDDEGELEYRPGEQNMTFEMLGMAGEFPVWRFLHEDHWITIYGAALLTMPVGENLEEIEYRALAMLHLIE